MFFSWWKKAYLRSIRFYVFFFLLLLPAIEELFFEKMQFDLQEKMDELKVVVKREWRRDKSDRTFSSLSLSPYGKGFNQVCKISMIRLTVLNVWKKRRNSLSKRMDESVVGRRNEVERVSRIIRKIGNDGSKDGAKSFSSFYLSRTLYLLPTSTRVLEFFISFSLPLSPFSLSPFSLSSFLLCWINTNIFHPSFHAVTLHSLTFTIPALSKLPLWNGIPGIFRWEKDDHVSQSV